MERLQMLAAQGSVEQLRECGLLTIKQQMQLRKFVQSLDPTPTPDPSPSTTTNANSPVWLGGSIMVVVLLLMQMQYDPGGTGPNPNQFSLLCRPCRPSGALEGPWRVQICALLPMEHEGTCRMDGVRDRCVCVLCLWMCVCVSEWVCVCVYVCVYNYVSRVWWELSSLCN